MNPLTRSVESEFGVLFNATEMAFVNQVVESLHKVVAEEVRKKLIVHIASDGKGFVGKDNWNQFKEHLDEFDGLKSEAAVIDSPL